MSTFYGNLKNNGAESFVNKGIRKLTDYAETMRGTAEKLVSNTSDAMTAAQDFTTHTVDAMDPNSVVGAEVKRQWGAAMKGAYSGAGGFKGVAANTAGGAVLGGAFGGALASGDNTRPMGDSILMGAAIGGSAGITRSLWKAGKGFKTSMYSAAE